MGQGSRVVKRVSSNFRQKPDTGGMQRGPSKASGLQRLLVVPEGEPFEKMLVQRRLGADRAVKVSQVVPQLLEEFHLLIQEVTELRVCGGRTRSLQIQKGLRSGSSPRSRRLLWRPEFYSTHLDAALPHPGEECGHRAGFAA